GGGGLSRSARKTSRSRSESGAIASSTKGSSSSGMTRALRMRSSVSLTCSTSTVEFAKFLGRVMRAFSSVVEVRIVTAGSPSVVVILFHLTEFGILLKRRFWNFWYFGIIGKSVDFSQRKNRLEAAPTTAGLSSRPSSGFATMFRANHVGPARPAESISPAGEGPVEVEGGADQCQVRDRVREVARGLATRPGLLGIQPEVVAVTQHLLEQQPGLGQAGRVGPPGPGQRLDQPEAAHVERPLHS